MSLQHSQIITVDIGGLSQQVVLAGGGVANASTTIGTAPAAGQNPPAVTSIGVKITPAVDCFVRQGVAPVATNDGTDIFLKGGLVYEAAIQPGNKFSFNSTAAGNVYITTGG